jgi:hypothetical protein
MPNLEHAALQRRLSAVRKADLAQIMLTTVSRVGGQGALLSALAEAENARNRRVRRQRHIALRNSRDISPPAHPLDLRGHHIATLEAVEILLRAGADEMQFSPTTRASLRALSRSLQLVVQQREASFIEGAFSHLPPVAEAAR